MSKRRHGFSLVELVTALTLFLGVIGSLSLAAGRGLGLFQDSGVRLEVRTRAEKAIDRAARELLGAVASSLTPDVLSAPSAWTSELSFSRGADWLGGAPVLTPSMRLAWEFSPGESDDGTDENNNGLIDEGDIVLVLDEGLPTELRTVLATGMAEFLEGELPNGVDDNGNGLIDESGFCIAREGSLLILRATAARATSSTTTLQYTEEAAVGIRN